MKHQEKEINLQKEIFNSVDDISDLRNKFNDLKITLKDLQDEIDCKDKIINELTQEKDIPKHSCNSLANELELADEQLKTEKLFKRVESMGKKKNAKQLMNRKLKDLSKERDEEFLKLETKIRSLNTEEKIRCRFGWKCKRGPACHYDHTFLYSKVNKHANNPSKNKFLSI